MDWTDSPTESLQDSIWDRSQAPSFTPRVFTKALQQVRGYRARRCQQTGLLQPWGSHSPVAPSVGSSQLCLSPGTSSAEKNHPAESFTPLVKAVFIPDRSMGGCQLRPHLLVSIWDNSEGLSPAPEFSTGPAESFWPWHCSSSSVCPILFPLLSHPNDPPGKLPGCKLPSQSLLAGEPILQ